jgi:hypothetical protein
VYANRHYREITSKPDGTTVVKVKPLAKRWIEWEGRSECPKMVYSPGEPRITKAGNWNTWEGWGVEPKAGDVGPWKELLDFLFAGEPETRKWFERWCAYPIQHPGTKMYSSVMIWGRHQRTGKTMVAYMLMRIYGKNAIEIKNKDLKGGFNSWADNRQFVYGDEIAGNEARVDAEWLKGLVTERMVRINTKFMPEYNIEDHMNYFFSSNKPDALFLDDTDSRYLIHEVRGAPRAFYERCDQFLHNEGPAHLMHHLLNLDLGNFNPREHAPETTAKRNMILSGKSDLGMWCVQLREDPERILAPLGLKIAKEAELFTPSALLHAYDPENRGRVTAPGIGRELVRAGFPQLNGASPIRTKIGIVRLYAIRNQEKWEKASPKEMGAHYETIFGEGKF